MANARCPCRPRIGGSNMDRRLGVGWRSFSWPICSPGMARAADALVLGRTSTSGKPPGLFQVNQDEPRPGKPTRPSGQAGKGQPLYIFDEHGTSG